MFILGMFLLITGFLGSIISLFFSLKLVLNKASSIGKLGPLNALFIVIIIIGLFLIKSSIN